VFGDGAAPESADRRQHPVIVCSIGRGRRRQRRLRVGKPCNRHHRDRRYPWLVRLVLAGIRRLHEVAQLICRTPVIVRRRKRRRAKLPSARGVAEQLEPAAVWGERGKISVACPAGLAGLAGETRQRLRRRRDPCGRKAREKTGAECGDQELPRPKRKMTVA
jgi:hypothetical protein